MICCVIIFAAISGIKCLAPGAANLEKPLIFPFPKDIKIKTGSFEIDDSVFIMVPREESEEDKFLAGLLQGEFTDKYEHAVPVKHITSFSAGDRFILAGDISNPLVRDFCRQNGLDEKLKGLGPEGYILSVEADNAAVVANTARGALYGVESLRQIIGKKEGHILMPRLIVEDSPDFTFRGIKLYLPGRDNIPFFRRFIRDFAALYKFNTVILELNANMRLERHPELNAGAIGFARHLNQCRLDRPPGIHMEFQNSSHQDNADGGILEKEEVADLVRYMREFNIEVIPELPSLTHSYYLLAGHEELAENLAQPYPDTYCPLKPEIYKIYFDVLDEYIEVIHPSIIHIGHDEWRMEKNLCELCRGKDYGLLYANDVIKIHDYLAGKGIRTALWGDHLLESVTHKDHQEWESSTGYKYNIPGALTPEQVRNLIPKDILVFNWFWNDEKNDRQVSDFGFEQVYGNFTPDITGWDERVKTKGLIGGAPSSWAATTASNFGKDLVYDFLGCAALLWSGHNIPSAGLSQITQNMMGDIRDHFRGVLPDSETGSSVISVSIGPWCNAGLDSVTGHKSSAGYISGTLKTGNITFRPDLSSGSAKNTIVVSRSEHSKYNHPVSAIKIDRDVNSLIFLHACTKADRNEKAYRMIWNHIETARLLGWYEIIYDDGFIITVPIRYGVNILDLGWRRRELNPTAGGDEDVQRYVYEADAVEISSDAMVPVSFFSFEWHNPRPGKKIKYVNLKPASDEKEENAIVLLAISIAETPALSNAEGTENE